jgi:oligopeptide/dipeptide ABC transporter ATP-binding protein
MTAQALLSIDHLSLDIPDGDHGRRPLLRDVCLDIWPGESVGLVGESGSGKSLAARAILGLFPPAASTAGSIRLGEREILHASGSELRTIRASEVAMIFQDPRAHVNPIRTIGDHLSESMRFVKGMSRRAARMRSIELLETVQFKDPTRLLSRYPHELSGGMLQRVMIAGALAGSPKLLLADEPTTALDVTIQAEVMAVLASLRAERGLAVLLITHDLELAAATSERTAVMYAGSVVEMRPSNGILDHPRHPYSAALGRSRPSLGKRLPVLPTIGGRPIAAYEAPDGCAFADRCPFVQETCRNGDVALHPSGDGVDACIRSTDIESLVAAGTDR